MRTQKIVTIDLGADAQRRKYEPIIDFHRRVDETLSDRINAEQNALGEDWYMLSIVPSDNTFSPGTYLSTWEIDDEDEQVKGMVDEINLGAPKTLDEISENVKDRLEAEFGVSKFPEGFINIKNPDDVEKDLKKLTGNMEYGQGCCKDNEDSVAEDGDTSPHIQHGEVIRVNGVRFVCTSFQRDNGGASVEFTEYDEYLELMQSRSEAVFQLHNTERPNNRYFSGVEMPTVPYGGVRYGTRSRVSYNRPRQY
jgi:hypothetical protein